MPTTKAGSDPLADEVAKLRKLALAYPGAVEDFPWGEKAYKVNKKMFLCLFHGTYQGETFLNVTLKLPESHVTAVLLPFAAPTRYGLGQHGWITARFNPGDHVPIDILEAWLAESYRAVAPTALLAQLDGVPLKKARARSPSQQRRPVGKSTTAKKKATPKK